MSVKLTSYINLNGNATQALKFYQDIFGGTIQSDTFQEFNQRSNNAMPVPDQDKDKIMHATLTGEYIELMLSDVPSTWTDQSNQSNIVLALNGDDHQLIQEYWEKLAQGGTIDQPLEQAPWGDYFGSLVDQFGVRWMVDIYKAN
ncbi:VOC family protein [Candidatus Saccharibacteria bacterium]|nr:VOC family protein [Candidatus Saccharibacteria bacterium]